MRLSLTSSGHIFWVYEKFSIFGEYNKMRGGKALWKNALTFFKEHWP